MIRFQQVSLTRGIKPLFDKVDVTLNPGDKIGLIGSNGAGKSSLFAMLRGELHADQGEIDYPSKWRVAYVAQETPALDRSAIDYAIDGDITLRRLEDELAFLESEPESAENGTLIGELYSSLADADAYTVRSRAEQLLLGLGFSMAQMEQPVATFSGGWRMRLNLAQALMCPSDLLLLDEPTNHLDLDAIIWLEDWLKRYAGTLVIISHDRDFLDGVVNVIVHIDERKLKRYSGNYSAFERQRAAQMILAQGMMEKQARQRAHLESFIERFKAKASKAKQAQSRVKALDRMEKLAPVLTASDFTFEFREPANLPNPMLALDGVACGYGQTVIVRDISRSVLAGQRIGILGANGQGKSTLVKTIARTMPPLAGTLTEGKGLAIGYFAQQEMDLLLADDTPLQCMVRLAREAGPSAREQEIRDFLGQFRFTGDMVHQAVGSLSGGERARLVLATIVWQRPNLLLLDEPTNHLDLTTREALSMALNEFEGTVMLVSHDRALLREVCDEFWLVSRGGVAPFDGDLDDYQRWLLEQSREAARAAKKSAAAAPTPAPAQPVLRKKTPDDAKPLKAEHKRIDERLVKAGDERETSLAALADPKLAPGERVEHGKRLKALDDEVAALESRWLEICEALEQLS